MVDSQDAENVRQRRSCCAQSLHVPQGYASSLRLLWPCWTAFLSILRPAPVLMRRMT
jgi:hypothetical protein